MEPTKLFYTFGNHMHWVDMQWLWGYHVLPGSVRDMIHLCREAGVKGCVNFDGIGYEKLAAEDPEALLELRQAVQEGIIEPVGCSYGQPYGLFHGGESNIRQLIYGARAVRRLLGVWPKTFWEEEFYFFPQLPQMLKSCGFTGASLFFQWTWHTPEVPFEESPVIWWEGLDGSRILTATRNKLNLHQWPEDMDVVLKELASGLGRDAQTTVPFIQQWLELMPSPDWMCRSELILPKLKELLSDPRFEVTPVTLGEYLHTRGLGVPPEGAVEGEGASGQGRDAPENLGRGARATGLVPVRNYSMDQVWHGLTLGKNGDAAPRSSHQGEVSITSMEAISATLGLFGRPYADWDVYPVWETEEAWRNLLAAQHHDNHECEGLCGHVAESLYSASSMLADPGQSRIEFLSKMIPLEAGEVLVFNPMGWPRNFSGTQVPAFGYAVCPSLEGVNWIQADDGWIASSNLSSVHLDTNLSRLRLSGEHHDISLRIPQASFTRDGASVVCDTPTLCAVDSETVEWSADANHDTHFWCRLDPRFQAIDLVASVEPHPTNDPGLTAALRVHFRGWPVDQVYADTPYGVAMVQPGVAGRRKYPQGDWMTSPQWFEEIAGHFTSQSFVDFLREDGSGVLLVHDGSQQWLFEEGGLANIIGAVDPWDEHKADPNGRVRYALFPHGAIGNAERWKLGRELFGLFQSVGSTHFQTVRCTKSQSGSRPRVFAPLAIANPNVVITAFYREAEDYAGKHVENYAGLGMGYPYIIRLVEFDGLESEVELTVVGPVAAVYKTNLLGQIEEAVAHEFSHNEGKFSYEKVTFNMRAHEIATLYLDIVPGRKQTRDLDAKREIWATIHRTEIEP
ncbi:MAG: glycosyl hydrolase-related protein [Fimbriimonadaceae bacterium]